MLGRDANGTELQEPAVGIISTIVGEVEPDRAILDPDVRSRAEATGGSGEDAKAWLAEMKAANRYLVDIWPRG